MAENPLSKLARLVGGLALQQGRLGHQLLGQILILQSTDVEVAGANVAIAAASGQKHAIAQVALRTAAPALAVSLLGDRRKQRLDRIEVLTRERERQSDERARLLATQEQAAIATRSRLAILEAENTALKQRLDAASAATPVSPVNVSPAVEPPAATPTPYLAPPTPVSPIVDPPKGVSTTSEPPKIKVVPVATVLVPPSTPVDPIKTKVVPPTSVDTTPAVSTPVSAPTPVATKVTDTNAQKVEPTPPHHKHRKGKHHHNK